MNLGKPEEKNWKISGKTLKNWIKELLEYRKGNATDNRIQKMWERLEKREVIEEI